MITSEVAIYKTNSKNEVISAFDTLIGELPLFKDKVSDLEGYVDKILKFGKVLIAKCENSIAGMIVFYDNDMENKTAYISLIAVQTLFKRKKIGTKLLNKCYEISKMNNMKYVRLEVDNYNVSAVSFYKNHGFEETHEKTNTGYYMKKILSDDLEKA